MRSIPKRYIVKSSYRAQLQKYLFLEKRVNGIEEKNMMFVAMIGFQLSGALVLLINSIGASDEQIISGCFSSSNILIQDTDNNCIVEKEKLQHSAHNIYLNRFAFVDLVVGYIIAAFNPMAIDEKCIIIMKILFFVAILILIECFLAKIISKRNYKNDLKIPFKELEKMKQDIDTVITIEDVDKICSDESVVRKSKK
jgi:hypothetical protein